MNKRRPQLTASSYDLFNSFEMLLAIFLVAFGGVMLSLGWNNPRLAGYIPAGTINIVGGIVCAWLTWQRRGTQRSSMLPIMFFMNASSLVEHILKWRAKEEGAIWPMTLCILVVAILALWIGEEMRHRKRAARDSVCESTTPDMEDSP